MTLGFLVQQAVRKKGEEYLTWPQRALFDRIGIRRQVLETDPWGNFLLSGYDYGTARNWARLGLLYLRDGLWNGSVCCPTGGPRSSARPAPAWRGKEYGGQFWVNGEGQWNLPRRRLLHVRRRRAAHLRRPVARPRRRAHGASARGAGGHEAVESVAGRASWRPSSPRSRPQNGRIER